MNPDLISVILRLHELSGCLTLPNGSHMLSVGRLRYIQSRYEESKYRNPDTLIGEFIPPLLRWLSMLQVKLRQSSLRLDPFYYYLLARTIYYDRVFFDAAINTKFIINIGCGTDTRAYRFSELLRDRQVHVLECDQPRTIFIKEKLAKRRWCTDHVTYVGIDLDDNWWPELEYRIEHIDTPVLVMLEGVSPYIDERTFTRFLKFIAEKVLPGSRVAYDFKTGSVDDDFVRVSPIRNFRLPHRKSEIVAYHKRLGYELEQIEFSSELSSRLLPSLPGFEGSVYAEDCLLKLNVRKIKKGMQNSRAT